MTQTIDARTETAQDRTILQALRTLDGRATVGDVVARTGLAQPEAEASLRRLLESRRGHLEVGEAGTLLYRFEPNLVRRDHEPFWSRARRKLWDAFKTGFKVWTLVMLVVYLVVFVALLLAAIFAGKRGGDGEGGGWGGGRDRGHGHGHGFHVPSFWFWYWIWSPGWGWNRPYYGHRWEERMGGSRKVRVPLYKKVFAFVFGPDRARPTQAQKDRPLLRLVRARRGVLTTADLVQHTGLRRHEAEEELGRLVAAYDGDVKVAADGTLVYVFPELMVSAHGRVADRAPDPAWRGLEPSLPVTGNSAATDLGIGAVNAFNLVAAATAPLFIFPRLGLGGPGAWVFLVWVPLVFSTAFFSIPLVRSFAVRRENGRRAERNLRRVLLAPVFRASLVGDGAQPVNAAAATAQVQQALGKGASPRSVEAELLRLTADWDAHVAVGADGQSEYRFKEIRKEFRAADEIRRTLRLEAREVGEIVYSSADDSTEASIRDQRAFDRALAEGAPSPAGRETLSTGDVGLGRYLPSADRVAYVDDFELVAFEEEMRSRVGVRR